MTIAEEGFLSPDVARYVTKHREDNKAVFDLADALNRTAQRFMLGSRVTLEGDVFSAKNVAMLLLVRAISNFEGTVLMAERCAVVEARTLARTCLETVFAMVAALRMDADFIDRMVANEMGSKAKAANWLLNRADRADFVQPEGDEKLQAFLDRLIGDNEPLGSFATEEMARRAGLDHLYPLFRQLSSDAAHPMLEALNRYVDNGQGGVGPEITWGPKCGGGEIADTVLLACSFLMAGVLALDEVASVEGIGDALGEHFETLQALNEAKAPAEPA